MTTSPTVSLSDDKREDLLNKLARSQEDAQSPTSNAQTDAELALTLIMESGRFQNEEEVGNAVDQYLSGTPLTYITERHAFGGLDLVIRKPVYIPRIETEQWVLSLASSILPHCPSDRPTRILDICSGSGCIPLLLASKGKGRIHTVGLEFDPAALAVARENIRRNGLDQVSSFVQCDIFQDPSQLIEELGKFDMVISNPPYVSAEDLRKVEGKWHEGNWALQGRLKEGESENDDGYSFYRRILTIYPDFLSSTRPKSLPKVVLEVGSKQSQKVQELYKAEGRIEVHRETARRKDLSAPRLEAVEEEGSTERCIWIYAE